MNETFVGDQKTAGLWQNVT